MDFICDVVAVGFWFTVGASLCVSIAAVLVIVGLTMFTNYSYAKYKKEN